MSSRGAKIKNGHITTDEYETITVLANGEKVLQGIGRNHSLPDYSHSPNSVYIKMNKQEEFKEMRIYNKEGFPIIEFGYHGEESLTGNRHEKVLHYHLFDGDLSRDSATYITDEIYKKYSSYLEDVKEWMK